MRSNLPSLKKESRNDYYWARDLSVNGLTVGRGRGNNITNSAFGALALRSNTTGSNNTANGFNSLQANLTGSSNTAIGTYSLFNNTTGYNNTATGNFSQWNNTTGYFNTAFGAYSLWNNQTSIENTAIGYYSLNSCYSKGGNTAIGAYSAKNCSTSGNNTTIGTNSLYTNTTGGNNTITGCNAAYSQNGQTVTSGSFVIGASYTILTAGTTTFTAIGAANNNVGTVFTATGVGTGTGTATLNHQTVANGYNASYSNLSGHNTTALGVAALYANTAFYNVTGVGANSAVTGSNQVQLGDSATTTYAYGAVQDRSDIRDKADVRDTVLGLAFINALRPVDFRWDKREDYRTPPPIKPAYPVQVGISDEEYKMLCDAIDTDFEVNFAGWLEANKLKNITHDGSKKRTRYHHGVIAQEVPEEFGGLQNHALKGGDDVLSIGYEEFIAPLIKAIQELSANFEAYKLEHP